MEVRKLNWFLPVFLAVYVILNIAAGIFIGIAPELRSEEHTSELQSPS